MNNHEFAKKIVRELDKSPISLKTQERLTQARYMAVEKMRLQEARASEVKMAGGFSENFNLGEWIGNKTGNWRVWLAAGLVALAASVWTNGMMADNSSADDDDVDAALQVEAQSFRGMMEAIDSVMKSPDMD